MSRTTVLIVEDEAIVAADLAGIVALSLSFPQSPSLVISYYLYKHPLQSLNHLNNNPMR
jgi:hypothetical protein